MMNLKEERIGMELTTNENCKVVIVDYVNAHKVQVMFLDEHKWTVWTNWSVLKRGELRNPFHPSVYGIGYLGVMKNGERPKTKIEGKMIREYVLWNNMMARCYDEKTRQKHPSYKNVTVCKEWHNYSTFLEDLPKIRGYEEWLNSKKYDLNKDMYYSELGIETDEKVYSLETCQFILRKENVDERMDRCGNPNPRKRVRCIELNTVYDSIRQAEREIGIYHGDISKCCRGKLKSCKGLRFEYVE